jgi:serine/threonine-protein kinase
MVCPHCRGETPETLDRCVHCAASLGPDIDVTVASPPLDATMSASSAATISGSHGGSHAGGMFTPGSLFASRYRITRMLGAGGMGAVYEAWDHELGVTIALKVIRTEVITDPGAARDYERRFKQELLLARKVSHPNVVRIHDMGDAGGVKYITMSYVEGADLASLLKGGALPIDRARRLGAQLLSGLAAAHDVGIAHRDLKPQNILVDSKDHLYISDFGLAKSLEPTMAGLTRTGEFLGTPRYISPEQVEGRPADHRGDLYAVGLILYEMVTGDAPFSGPSAMELMLQRVQQRPKSARSQNPDVPEYFDRIIMRCLEKDPAARYQDAHEALADLRGERSTTGASLPRTKTISWTVPVPSKRTGILTASLGVVLVSILAFAAARGYIFSGDPEGGTPTAAAAAAPLRIAVLPFSVSGDDPALASAAAGIEEALASKLFQLKQVNVASAGVVQAAVREGLSGEPLAREVGVSHLVSGIVQGSSDRLRVTVNLYEGAERRWSRDFTFVPGDLLTTQDQIFSDLAAPLDLSLSADERLATLEHPTENVDAYAAYLRGRQAMRDDQDLANVEAAIRHFEEALKGDQRFALAYTGIADASIRMFRETKDDSWATRAVSAAEQARALDDSLLEVQLALGNVYQATGRTNEAIVVLNRATEMAPNSDEAYRRLGRVYRSSGRVDEAIAAYDRAVAINPYHWVNSAQLGVTHAMAANYDRAIEALGQVTKLAPDNAAGFNDLGAVYMQAGRPAEAIPVFQQALKLDPLPDTYSNLGVAYAQAGQFAEAVPMFEKAVELQPRNEVFVGNLADGYRWAGLRAKALATYDQAIALALNDLQVNPRDAMAKASLALYHAKKGNAAQARKSIGDARAIDKGNVDLIYNEAVICALIEDVACAVANLQQSLEAGYTIQIIEADPDLRRLRDDPAYRAMKAKFGGATPSQ